MSRGAGLLARRATQQGCFDILVEDGFVLTEMAGIVDVLRIANRVCQQQVFEWTYRSASGGIKYASSGAMVETESLPTRPVADYAFVLGNAETDVLVTPQRHILRTYAGRPTRLFLLAEAASIYIQNHTDSTAHTTHWENRLALSEQIDASEWGVQLASDHDGITTCAGMGATVDLVLSLAVHHMSQPALRTVCDILLHDRIRDLRTPQPFSTAQVATTGDPDLDACIALMQANMEEPLAINDLCKELKISTRSLERKFSSRLGMTPNSYYRELRLNQASTLLLNTPMSIREVGLACGFANGFASQYRSVFGHTPADARRAKRRGAGFAIPNG